MGRRYKGPPLGVFSAGHNNAIGCLPQRIDQLALGCQGGKTLARFDQRQVDSLSRRAQSPFVPIRRIRRPTPNPSTLTLKPQ